MYVTNSVKQVSLCKWISIGTLCVLLLVPSSLLITGETRANQFGDWYIGGISTHGEHCFLGLERGGMVPPVPDPLIEDGWYVICLSLSSFMFVSTPGDNECMHGSCYPAGSTPADGTLDSEHLRQKVDIHQSGEIYDAWIGNAKKSSESGEGPWSIEVPSDWVPAPITYVFGELEPGVLGVYHRETGKITIDIDNILSVADRYDVDSGDLMAQVQIHEQTHHFYKKWYLEQDALGTELSGYPHPDRQADFDWRESRTRAYTSSRYKKLSGGLSKPMYFDVKIPPTSSDARNPDYSRTPAPPFRRPLY